MDWDPSKLPNDFEALELHAAPEQSQEPVQLEDPVDFQEPEQTDHGDTLKDAEHPNKTEELSKSDRHNDADEFRVVNTFNAPGTLKPPESPGVSARPYHPTMTSASESQASSMSGKQNRCKDPKTPSKDAAASPTVGSTGGDNADQVAVRLAIDKFLPPGVCQLPTASDLWASFCDLMDSLTDEGKNSLEAFCIAAGDALNGRRDLASFRQNLAVFRSLNPKPRTSKPLRKAKKDALSRAAVSNDIHQHQQQQLRNQTPRLARRKGVVEPNPASRGEESKAAKKPDMKGKKPSVEEHRPTEAKSQVDGDEETIDDRWDADTEALLIRLFEQVKTVRFTKRSARSAARRTAYERMTAILTRPGIFNNPRSPFVVTKIRGTTRKHITFTAPADLLAENVVREDDKWMRNAIVRHNETPGAVPIQPEDFDLLSGNSWTLKNTYIDPKNFRENTGSWSPPDSVAYQWMSNILVQYYKRWGAPLRRPEHIIWSTAQPEHLEALGALFLSRCTPEKLHGKAPHETSTASHHDPEAASNASSAKSADHEDDTLLIDPNTPQRTSRQADRRMEREKAKKNGKGKKKHSHVF